MRTHLLATLALGVALFTNIVPPFISPASAQLITLTRACGQLDGTEQVQILTVPLGVGDTITFSKIVFVTVSSVLVTVTTGAPFTAVAAGTYTFIGDENAFFTATCTPASPFEDLASRTLWQTAQHRDDTQQGGVEGAIRQRFSGGTGASGGATENSLNFVTSFAALTDSRQPSALSSMNTLVADDTLDTPWNAWVSGRVDLYDGDASNFDGGMTTIVTGLDYLLTDHVVVGGFLSYNWSQFDLTAMSSVDSTAFSVGAYAGFNIHDIITAELFGAYSLLDYDVRAAAVTGRFDAVAIALGLNVYGTLPLSPLFTLEPNAQLKYNAEWHEAYVNSASVAVASQDFDRLRLALGTRLYYEGLMVSGGVVRPWASVSAEYAFTDNNTLNAAGTASLGDFGYLDTSLGLTATFDRMLFEISTDIGGIGSGEYTRYGGEMIMRIRF